MKFFADSSLLRTAISATAHCLIGCGIGEVCGLVIGTALNWGGVASIALAVGLAFLFGYLFTLVPILRSMPLKSAVRIALAADTVSITVMEIVDNAAMLLLPGALHVGLGHIWFWLSMLIALSAAFIVAVPVNYWLIGKGLGHAKAHNHHHAHHH